MSRIGNKIARPIPRKLTIWALYALRDLLQRVSDPRTVLDGDIRGIHEMSEKLVKEHGYEMETRIHHRGKTVHVLVIIQTSPAIVALDNGEERLAVHKARALHEALWFFRNQFESRNVGKKLDTVFKNGWPV